MTYQHEVIRWNGTQPQAGCYQLHVTAIGQHGKPIQRAQWTFKTFRGLLVFLQHHFPDCDLLHGDRLGIQFRVIPTLHQC